MEVFYMGIAENIKRRRLELDISQQELANAMGYKSRSTIAKIEAGENEVPESKIHKFAKALDTSVEFLRTGIEVNKISFSVEAKEYSGQQKNVVIVLAGGKSTRNMQNIPNQFINVLGKPVIVYCLEAYQKHPAIDDIFIVCLKDWDGILEAYAQQYGINKLRGVIQAGETGILSVKNGVDSIKSKYSEDDIIIFQEATRPLVTEEMISKLLNACKRNGSAVTCEPMNEYVQFELSNDDIESSHHSEYLNRHRVVTVQSPEAYRLDTVIDVFSRAEEQRHKLDETCLAMMLYNLGYELQFYEGNHNNIKIVRQEDIAILSALLKQRM
jgi:2-C-methyl-D-erythritol 4-phosphate cytidylyltransferase